MSDWQDRLAGARMRVDQRFEQRVADSQFSNQEWGLIMTAVKFDVEAADDADRAQLVADTEKLEAVVPELERIQDETTDPSGRDDDSGGILSRLSSLLGGADLSTPSNVSDEELAAARGLVDDYAAELQAYLEEQGSWQDVRAMAADAEDGA